MKLWLFTFTQPDRMLLSARVAAPNHAVAAAVMGRYLDRPLVGAPNRSPEQGTILQYFGEDKRITEAQLISAIASDDELMVPK